MFPFWCNNIYNFQLWFEFYSEFSRWDILCRWGLEYADQDHHIVEEIGMFGWFGAVFYKLLVLE